MKAMTPRQFSSKTTLYKTRTWDVACHSVGGSKTTWRNSGFMHFIKKVMLFSRCYYTYKCFFCFFCKSKETIGYYHYITDKRIYCCFFFRPFPTRVWWLLLEDTTGTLHRKNRPGDADRVFPALPSGFHLHDNECYLSGRSTGSFIFHLIHGARRLRILMLSCHAHMFYLLSSFSVVPWVVVLVSCVYSTMPWTRWSLFRGSMLPIVTSRSDFRTYQEWSALSPKWSSISRRIIIPGLGMNW